MAFASATELCSENQRDIGTSPRKMYDLLNIGILLLMRGKLTNGKVKVVTFVVEFFYFENFSIVDFKVKAN